MKNLLAENMRRFGTKNLSKLNENYNPDRQQYYDMMEKGELPDVDLTYKLDKAWFDNHTDTTIFDNATSNSGLNDKQLAYALYIVRTGTKGVNPKTKTFKVLRGDEREAATQSPIDDRLRKLAGYKDQGTGAPD